MITIALNVTELAALLNRYASRAYDENLRNTDETDAVLLGELTMLEAIAERLCLTDREPSEREEEALRSARDHAGRAIDHLQACTR
jgi:hypothetical protein